jgi:uncharacterized protein YbaR (Trm112 family)
MTDGQNMVETTGAIAPELLALLVCPVDKGALALKESTLLCSVCGRVYPIEDGIPNMLADIDA